MTQIEIDHAPKASATAPLLSVRNLSYLNEENVRALKDISFDVRAGEILVADAVGSTCQNRVVKIFVEDLASLSISVRLAWYRSRL